MQTEATTWTFTPLGDFTGGVFQSGAYDVSDDGTVVVGSGTDGVNNKGFRWTAGTGLTPIETSPLYSHSSAVSADGAVVAGWVWNQFNNPPSPIHVQALRHTTVTGAIGLGDLAGGTFESYANDISADGSVAAGLGRTDQTYEATFWTQSTGMVSIGDLPGGITHSGAFGISRDGTVIVGAGTSSLGQEAFMWTQANGMVGLGDLPNGIFRSHAEDVLAGGQVVVGYANSILGQEAFRWTAATGMVGLGDLSGGLYESHAWGGAADGSIVVGHATTADGASAFIWDQSNGILSLQALVASEGLQLPGWRLSHALAMSADGRFIVGQGINPDGNLEAWIIGRQVTVSSAIPEPATLVMSLLCFTVLGVRRRTA